MVLNGSKGHAVLSVCRDGVLPKGVFTCRGDLCGIDINVVAGNGGAGIGDGAVAALRRSKGIAGRYVDGLGSVVEPGVLVVADSVLVVIREADISYVDGVVVVLCGVEVEEVETDELRDVFT